MYITNNDENLDMTEYKVVFADFRQLHGRYNIKKTVTNYL